MFRIEYDPNSGIEKASLNSWVVDALREQTDRSAIAELYESLGEDVRSPVLNSMDPETIRKAIHIQGRPGENANSIEYRLSLVGDGTEDEIEFVNAIVGRINSQLNFKVTRDNREGVIQELTGQFREFHDERMRQISGQLETVIGQLATSSNDLKIAQSDLQTITVPAGTGNNIMARPTKDRLQTLQSEKARLIRENGFNEYHPRIAAIRKEIESLSNSPEELAAPTDRSSSFKTAQEMASDNTSFSVNPNGSAVVKNQFAGSVQENGVPSVNASAKSTILAAPIKDIAKSIELIDLERSRQVLADTQESLDDTAAVDLMVDRLGERAVDGLQVRSPINLADFELARRSIPIGGAPTTNQFLILMLISGVFGTVVALNYDPAVKRRPFKSVEQLQRRLNMPVIGVLRNRVTETRFPLNKLLAHKSLRICEWTLLALGVLLILAALANSEVAAAFIENPFHGITRTIWIISPAH